MRQGYFARWDEPAGTLKNHFDRHKLELNYRDSCSLSQIQEQVKYTGVVDGGELKQNPRHRLIARVECLERPGH